MNRLKKKYFEEVVPLMQAEFGYKNKMAVPKLLKATINAGISANKKDDKYNYTCLSKYIF